MAEICHLENRHNANVIFYAESGTIWIKFCRLVQNDMSTASDSLAIIALYKLVLCYVCYVTFVYCVETSKLIIKLFSLSGSH